MKKKVLATAGTLTAAAIIGLGFSQSGVVSADPTFNAQDIREKVTSQYPGKITELELDKHSGNPVYEVEIDMNGKEYELAIDGNTAEVLKINERERVRKDLEQKITNDTKNTDDVKGDKEISIKEKEVEIVKEETEQKPDLIVQNTSNDDDVDDKHTKKEEESTKQVTQNEKEKTSKSQEVNKEDDKQEKQKENNKTNKKAVIGESRAKEIALGQFAGYVEEIELDEDDGRLVYEIEIEGSNGEAEIEIDAFTGKVIVVDIDMED